MSSAFAVMRFTATTMVAEVHSWQMAVVRSSRWQINAEKCPFLVERLRIFCLPTLCMIKDGKVHPPCRDETNDAVLFSLMTLFGQINRDCHYSRIDLACLGAGGGLYRRLR